MNNAIKRLLISSMVLISAVFSMNSEKVSAMGVTPSGYVRGLYFSYNFSNDRKIAEYLGNYDMYRGEAIRLFPREQWPIVYLVDFLKERCSAVKLLYSQGVREVYVRFATESSLYKFIDENIDYFRKIVNSRTRKKFEENGIFLGSEDLIYVINQVKWMIGEPGAAADETWTDDQKWSYLDSAYHYDYACSLYKVY